MVRLTVGDLSRFGIRRPAEGPFAMIRRRGRIPLIDVYMEEIVAGQGGAPDGVRFQGKVVPLEKRHEVVTVGLFGRPQRTVEFDLEIVPHHGPILPQVQNGEVMPRTGGQALSVRWVGFDAARDASAFLVGPVLKAASQRPPRLRGELPAGLGDREVKGVEGLRYWPAASRTRR